MRKLVGLAAVAGATFLAPFASVLGGCEPPAARQAVVAADTAAVPHADSCREDVPDCVAVCALRETHRTEYLDFYERRCAAVILGKNPDRVEALQATPYPSTRDSIPQTQPTASGEFPPDHRASLSLQPPPAAFDPSAVTRTGSGEPPECKAARMLRAQRRDREADMLGALCAAKGGDAGP